VKSGYISVYRLKVLEVLNMDRELPMDYIQEEIEQNLDMLKSKLEIITTLFEDFLYQVVEKRKYLKDKYDDLIARKEKDQQKFDSDNLKKQYKSHIFTLEKAMIEKDRKI
ncbi:17843_t:CDS:2, partial [Funneliformis geosporum]